MIELKVTNVNDFIYELKNEEDGKTYEFNLEFRDIDSKVKVGDYIFINDMLLDPKYEGYSYMYTFGDMNSEYGRENLKEDDVDVIKLIQEDKEILLKRLYG